MSWSRLKGFFVGNYWKIVFQNPMFATFFEFNLKFELHSLLLNHRPISDMFFFIVQHFIFNKKKIKQFCEEFSFEWNANSIAFQKNQKSKLEPNFKSSHPMWWQTPLKLSPFIHCDKNSNAKSQLSKSFAQLSLSLFVWTFFHPLFIQLSVVSLPALRNSTGSSIGGPN